MNPLVNLSVRGHAAVITINNPPVNALSPGVPEGIDSSIDAANADTQVRVIILMGGDRTFVAGADINEFAKSIAAGRPGGPNLHPLLLKLEDSPKPIVIAIHGSALGAGLELAMAGHYRVASPDAQMGLPEVNLGIVPGGEGTQRLPRLVGVAKAIEMIVTGQIIKAPEALQFGLLDKIIEGDLLDSAVKYGLDRAANNESNPKTRENTAKLGTPETNVALFAAGRDKARRTRRNQTAPLASLDALAIATMMPFEQGCKNERVLSDQSLQSDQCKALIHAFLAERAAAKIPDIPTETATYPIRQAGIIGAGTMGGGIAMALANAGIPVRIADCTQAALDRGMAVVRKNYENSLMRGRLTSDELEQRLMLIHPQIGYAGFEEADIIIEAVFESMDLKKQIFAGIDRVAKPDCVLATNTSTLDIDEIAASTSRPAMVVGAHFFGPAHVMRLLEIVRGNRTDKRIIATVLRLAKTLRKVGVLVGNGYGFVGNRMMFQYMREAQLLVEEGATPAQVDAVLTEWGMAMGIFAVDDMGGLDLGARVFANIRCRQGPGLRMPMVLDKLVARGRLGQKTGSGWFRYDETQKPISDHEIEALIEETAKDLGIRRRAITKEEILERCIYCMINEGAKILEEGIAGRAADIDTIYLTGYGFPAYRGGPMWYADSLGLDRVLARVREFYSEAGALWKPAPLLEKLAAEHKTFAAWDEAQATADRGPIAKNS